MLLLSTGHTTCPETDINFSQNEKYQKIIQGFKPPTFLWSMYWKSQTFPRPAA